MTIRILEEGFGNGVALEIGERTRGTIDRLADAGAAVTEVSIGSFGYVDEIKNVISYTELATHWRAGATAVRRNSTVDEGYQAGFVQLTARSSGCVNPYYRSRLLAGAQLMEAHHGRPYTRAQRARSVVREDLDAALVDAAVLALPTIPDVAPRLENATDPERPPARNCRLANVASAPAITLPNGTVDGLPIGLQLVAAPFDDAELLGVAKAVEDTVDTGGER